MQTLSAGQYQGDPTVLSQLRKFGKGLSNKQQVQAEKGGRCQIEGSNSGGNASKRTAERTCCSDGGKEQMNRPIDETWNKMFALPR